MTYAMQPTDVLGVVLFDPSMQPNTTDATDHDPFQKRLQALPGVSAVVFGQRTVRERHRVHGCTLAADYSRANFAVDEREDFWRAGSTAGCESSQRSVQFHHVLEEGDLVLHAASS